MYDIIVTQVKYHCYKIHCYNDLEIGVISTRGNLKNRCYKIGATNWIISVRNIIIKLCTISLLQTYKYHCCKIHYYNDLEIGVISTRANLKNRCYKIGATTLKISVKIIVISITVTVNIKSVLGNRNRC